MIYTNDPYLYFQAVGYVLGFAAVAMVLGGIIAAGLVYFDLI